MTDVNFLTNCLDKLNKLREEEFKNNSFIYEEKIIEKKVLNENTQEYKKYQSTIKKKASLEKNKPGNISKKEYETTNEEIDILGDNLFNSNFNENTEDDAKIDIELLDTDKKMVLINDFLQRKNIVLDENEKNKIDEIINNTNIILKKYITISKVYQQIIKITFIKKLENGTYIIDLNENKPRKSKKYFLK